MTNNHSPCGVRYDRERAHGGAAPLTGSGFKNSKPADISDISSGTSLDKYLPILRRGSLFFVALLLWTNRRSKS